MPHTHALYQPYFTGPSTGHYKPSCSAPAPLDEALDNARSMTYSGLCGTYTVQPVPGTEPRYRLSCNANSYGDMTAAAHHNYNGGAPLPWREAAKLYQQWLASTVNPTHWYGLVAA